MLQIANREVRVDLLDPASDQLQLGPRFCAGGYIWQVHDQGVGSLLTGPEWPRADPQIQNGQGLPESFRHTTTTGDPLLWNGPVGLAPGGGALARNADGVITITEPCLWQIELEPERAEFRTLQNVATWSYSLERVVELRGRLLRSYSRLTNRSSSPLVLQWFAHPYFALGGDGLLRATLPAGTRLSENAGYILTERELSLRRAFVGEFDGHLENIDLPPGRDFSVNLSHPKLSSIHFATDFPPSKCVLWANGNTLSFEPFLDLKLAAGESREWNLTYDFGPATIP